MASHRVRRIRRAEKAALKHGAAAKPKHALPHGRTGNYHHRLEPSKQQFGYNSHRPSIGLSDTWNIDKENKE